MSREIPDHLGELSTAKLQEAINALDTHLQFAPQDIRDALSIIRLVTSVPRRGHWYGISIDPDDSSCTVGVVLRNLIEIIEQDRGLGLTRNYRDLLLHGRRQYDEYLGKLFDPGGHAHALTSPLR